MKRHVTHQVFAIIVIMTVLGSISCGDASFTAGTGKAPIADDKPQDIDSTKEVVDLPPPIPTLPADPGTTPPVMTTDKSLGLTWFWKCEAATLPDPVFPQDNELMRGNSAHTLPLERFSDVPMTVRSQICPVDQSRDIIFLVDVSGSMNQSTAGNDPKTLGTCNRLEAVKRIIETTGGVVGGRFAVVTFSGATTFVSTVFGATLAEALGGGDAAAIICAASGGTNYQAPLVAAENLFLSARVGSSREVYVISDGLPDKDGSGNGPEDPAVNGKAEAQRLRDRGVQIATAMLGDNVDGDLYMRTFVSSKITQTGGQVVVMHGSIANTNDLVRVLNELANNDITSGEFKYRSIGASEWQMVDLLKYRKGGEFQMPAMKLSAVSSPNGIEIEINYQDRRRVTHSSSGHFSWRANQGP